LDDTTRDSIHSNSKNSSKSYISEKLLDQDYERELNLNQNLMPVKSQRKDVGNTGENRNRELSKLFPLLG
jgi:urease alpha subunit